MDVLKQTQYAGVKTNYTTYASVSWTFKIVGSKVHKTTSSPSESIGKYFHLGQEQDIKPKGHRLLAESLVFCMKPDKDYFISTDA